MTPREFEKAVADTLRSEGYKTELGPGVNDWGVDVIATKGPERLAVQAKMYGNSTRQVNRECLMQLYGAAAYFDCTSAVLATDGFVMADAQAVATKLGIRILRMDRTTDVTGVDDPSPDVFDAIWRDQIMPLAGRTLIRADGSANTIISVDWSGLERVTSGGNRQFIPIDIFRFAVDHIYAHGFISRDLINQHFPRRASSGIVLILSQVPQFEVIGRSSGLRLRQRV